MLAMGKIEEIGREMKEYQIDVLALQEVRWKDEGRIDREEYTLFYGSENKQGRNGTGFMVSRRLRNSVMELNGIDEYIVGLAI